MGLLDRITVWRARKLKPGSTCPVSGQYRNSRTGRQATCVKGEKMPPGPVGKHSTWKLTDPTRHKEQ